MGLHFFNSPIKLYSGYIRRVFHPATSNEIESREKRIEHNKQREEDVHLEVKKLMLS